MNRLMCARFGGGGRRWPRERSVCVIWRTYRDGRTRRRRRSRDTAHAIVATAEELALVGGATAERVSDTSGRVSEPSGGLEATPVVWRAPGRTPGWRSPAHRPPAAR